MAAPSNNPLKFREAEEETVEEIDEGFDDFTLASSWERFISDIEAACRQWMIDGPKNLLAKGAEQLNPWKHLYKIKSEVKYGTKTYCMEYYFEFSSHGKIGDWLKDSHNLQIFFGVKDFVVYLVFLQKLNSH
ncbi:hypothetical protein ZOSMA_37G00170 [Zostera marina]|uniref:Uncharacterized protein n=1 Tax=Zostera marina TaxID=29655 RepID=A0A0K9P570_ZOSMR|nr:hypothetical protein ZOSMA_37G00170 [Zostera marina]